MSGFCGNLVVALAIGTLCFPFILASCQDSEDVTQDGAGTQGTSTPIKNDLTEVIAKINGEPVTVGELRQEMKAYLQLTGGVALRRLSPQQQAQVQNEVIQQMIIKSQLRSFAIENKLVVETSAVDAAIADMEAQAGGKEKLDAAIQRAGRDRLGIRGDLERDKLLELAVSHYRAGLVVPTDIETETYYQEHIDLYTSEESVAARHILFGVSSGDDEASKSKKSDMAAAVRKEILDGGDFVELAKTHSTCPSSSKGGDLGSFVRAKMVPPFSEAAFALKIGEISEVVETQFGYHLIKIHDRKEASISPLEEVKEPVVEHMQQSKVEEWYLSLLESAEVENLVQGK